MRPFPKLVLLALLTLVAALALSGAADAATPRAPKLASPANGARVQQLPAISWNAVRGAAEYEYQVAADSRFNSIALGTGPGKGVNKTYNLSAALDKTVPNGTYYWRVRGITAKDTVGAWSRVRRIVKSWNVLPQITGGDGAAVSWPSTPLVMRWSSVPYATKYIVSVATDPALSNLVLGSATRPTETQGINFVMPISLAPGTYYWAITPVDAEGRRGARSRVASFHWSWPTSTSTSLTDLAPEAGIFDDPMFSWNPIAGAARYEVEVNSAEDFAPGSRWCCSGTTTGTSLAPLQGLANNRYYWRVRAIDARGDAGVWNEGQPFEKTFDPTTPTVRNLTVRSAEGQALGGVPSTDTPIVTWDPVPGASLYEVQVGLYHSGLGCDFSKSSTTSALHANTATTAWTPLGANLAGKQGPAAWPIPQSSGALQAEGHTYCVRVLARTNEDAQHNQVVSAWTQVNGSNQPAFTYAEPPAPGSPGAEGLTTPASAYIGPASGTRTSLTPLFTWRRVAGANGYFVVIARDPRFTEVADVGFTNVPAYAPRLANEAPLSDETTHYYWAVMPTAQADGHEVFSSPCFATSTNPCEGANDNPQWFDKSSTPPSPLQPASGAEISSQPTFRWSGADNARSYLLQVAQDPTFGHPIDNVTTDATAYTSSSTYPADTVLYWRVRATDWSGQGLNWSPVQTFVRRLQAPVLEPRAPTTIFGPAPIFWQPVQGAVAYDLHIEQGTGKSTDSTFESPSASISTYYGAGITHFQVRAEFPTSSGTKVSGPFSPTQSSLLILAAPKGAHGVRSGSRLLLTWNPEPDAKQYQVEISKTNGFSSRIESHRLDGTSWAPNIDLMRKQYKGLLYWRVAPVDVNGGVGSFASGRFGGASRPASSCPSKGKQAKHVKSCKKHK